MLSDEVAQMKALLIMDDHLTRSYNIAARVGCLGNSHVVLALSQTIRGQVLILQHRPSVMLHCRLLCV